MFFSIPDFFKGDFDERENKKNFKNMSDSHICF